MTTQPRAKIGGEFGANGEWYEGGKFLNTIPENRKKEGSVKAKPRKQQVYPFAWEVTDREPIFKLVGVQLQYVDRYARDNFKLEPFAPGVAWAGNEFRGHTIQSLADAFNSGKRFIDEV